MANSMKGVVKEVGPTQSIPTKTGNVFQKRELILDCTPVDQYGVRSQYDNYPCFTFTQDRCAFLDNIRPGMMVEVFFDLQGRYYQPRNSYFNDIRGYKIEQIQYAATQPAPASQPIPAAPASAPQPMPAAPAPQPVQAPNAPYNAGAQQYAQYPQQTQYPVNNKTSGLPF